MSLSRAQAQIIATTEPFASMLRQLIRELTPLLRSVAVSQERHRARLVTRRKQRRSW